MFFTRGDIRYYQYNKELYPSVTSILNIKINKYLAKWQVKYTAKYAIENIKQLQKFNKIDTDYAVDIVAGASKRHVEEASEKGKRVHRWIHKRESKDNTKEVSGFNQQYLKWVEDFDVETLEQEIVCISNWSEEDKPRYAGTIDAICKIDNESWLIDFKTSKAIKNDTFLQLVAYGFSKSYLKNNETIDKEKPQNYGIVHLQQNKYRFLKLDNQYIDHLYDVFSAYYKVFKFNQKYKQMFHAIKKKEVESIAV